MSRGRPDEVLVAVGVEVVVHQSSRRLLGTSVGRPVVVGEVESEAVLTKKFVQGSSFCLAGA